MSEFHKGLLTGTSSFCSLRHFDLESGVRVTCDVGYLCTFLSLSVLDYTPDVHDRRQIDRQTDVRQHHRFMPPPISGGDNNCRTASPGLFCLRTV